jgi:decaprenyl-phosphate phosphoribosyltransferase
MTAYLQLMRPAQWIKNLAVLAGPVFALRADAESLRSTGIIFAAFCLISSASYAINDLLDRSADALHPVKKNRPIARGAVGPVGAVVFAIILLAGGISLCVRYLPPSTTVSVSAYFVMILSYSLALKRRVILDVILIAVGFVLRATAGAEAIGVLVSPWLVVCTFTLCMFLGFGKRRCEIAQYETAEEAGEHRITLLRYTPELLNNLISISAGITIITFLLYTMDRDIPAPFPKEHLVYTLPLVVYGIFRYAMLIESGERHGPMDIILHDRAFMGTVLAWGAIALAIMTENYWLPASGLDGVFTTPIAPG